MSSSTDTPTPTPTSRVTQEDLYAYKRVMKARRRQQGIHLVAVMVAVYLSAMLGVVSAVILMPLAKAKYAGHSWDPRCVFGRYGYVENTDSGDGHTPREVTCRYDTRLEPSGFTLEPERPDPNHTGMVAPDKGTSANTSDT